MLSSHLGIPKPRGAPQRNLEEGVTLRAEADARGGNTHTRLGAHILGTGRKQKAGRAAVGVSSAASPGRLPSKADWHSSPRASRASTEHLVGAVKGTGIWRDLRRSLG